MKIFRRGIAAIGAAGLAALIVACGSAGSPAGNPGSAAPAARPASGTPHSAAFNATDVACTRTMVVVEGQVEAMASLAARHAASPRVRQYATRMHDQARARQRQMLGWLSGWHQPAPAPWSPGSAIPYRMGPGMMGSPGWSAYWDNMSRGWHAVRRMHGPAFGTAWTAMMARGFTAEITLAQQELRSGVSTRARSQAQSMIVSRRAGLARLQHWYRTWGGPNGNRRDWWNRWNGWNWPAGWRHKPSGNTHHRWNRHSRWNQWAAAADAGDTTLPAPPDCLAVRLHGLASLERLQVTRPNALGRW